MRDIIKTVKRGKESNKKQILGGFKNVRQKRSNGAYSKN